MKSLQQVSVLLLVLGVWGCRSIPDDLQPFMGQPSADAVRSLKGKPLEEQVDIYLRVRSLSRPPNYFLAAEIVRDEPALARILQKRLGSDSSDATKLDLLHLAFVFCLANDCKMQPDLMGQLKATGAGLSDPRFREEARDLLQLINAKAR